MMEVGMRHHYEIGSKTSLFYGDLIEASMGKDVIRITVLIDTLSDEEIKRLELALIKITIVSNSVVGVRTDAS